MAPVAIDVEKLSLKENAIEEKKDAEEKERNKEVEAVAKPTIGIIYPPPEVRSILSNCRVTKSW